jgi:hypothetical protein
MNNLIKITLGFVFFLQLISVKAASVNKLIFEDNGQNISRPIVRQWEFDKASWKMSMGIRDTARISSFSILGASKEEAKIMVPNESVLNEVKFAAVEFVPVKKNNNLESALEHSRNEKTTPTANVLENIGAETTKQFTKKGLSLDSFFPQLKMGDYEPL